MLLEVYDMGEAKNGDQAVMIHIQGLHCHRCEGAIRKALVRNPGVHEVEVDFPSGLASVLFDCARVSISQLMEAVNEAGYQATGFTQVNSSHAPA